MLEKSTQQADTEVNSQPLEATHASAFSRLRQINKIAPTSPTQLKSASDITSLLASWESLKDSIRAVRRLRLFMLANIVAVGLLFYSDVHSTRIAVLFIASLSGIAYILQLSLNAVLKRRLVALERLANTTEIKVVGAIIEACDYSDEPTRRLAKSALCKLLPRFQQCDETLLRPSHRRILNDVLKQAPGRSEDLQLKCAILKAYEQVGDESAIPIVARLARDRTPRYKHVREAALACLPFLQQRAGPSQLSRELLRAGTPETKTTAALLRPATSSVTEPPEELLRPPN